MQQLNGSSKEFYCKFCGKTECKTDVELKEHMKTAEHRRNQRIAVKARIQAIKMELKSLQSWVASSRFEQ